MTSFKKALEAVFAIDALPEAENAEYKNKNEIKLTSWEGYGDSVILHSDSEIPADARVSACWKAHVTFKPPFDTGTRLPIVAFYNKEINK